ncbi:MAG: SlyX family protein [Candidatus Sericytochromatia bacterium]
MSDDLDARLIELETRAAYQEDTILKLEELARAQQQQMYHMENRLALLTERLRSIVDRDAGEIPNEKPPHY